MSALSRGDDEMADCLACVGADPNARSTGGDTALLRAAATGETDVVMWLTRLEGIDVDGSHGVDDVTPLVVAAQKQHDDCVRVLAGAGGTVDKRSKYADTPLTQAINAGAVSMTRCLVECGANVNVVGRGRRTALMCAALQGEAFVRVLLSAGASDSINEVDPDKRSALILAARQGKQEVVAALVDAGADVNLVDKTGQTALTSLSRGHRGYAEMVACLASGGADLNRRVIGDARKPPLLLRAIEEREDHVAMTLVQNGAYVDKTDDNGSTALMAAARRLDG